MNTLYFVSLEGSPHIEEYDADGPETEFDDLERWFTSRHYAQNWIRRNTIS